MLMWSAGLVSWVGNYTLFIALPVYVYGETGSTLATSFSVMANALPMVFIGQFTGVLVDRFDYRRTLLFANFVLVGVTLLFLNVLAAPWWLVVPIAFLQSSVGQFVGPAENALLPTLVEMQGMTLGRWGSLAVVAVAVLVLIDLAWVLLATQARRFVQSARAVRTANRCSAGVMVGAAAAVATRS